MDNKDIRHGQDRELIAANEDYEVRYAAESFGVTEQEIKDAIAKVGNRRSDVEEYIRGRGRS